MSKYIVLIREPVKEFLFSHSKEREEFKKQFDELGSSGTWPGGLEVKTATGSNGPITVLEGQLGNGDIQLVLTPSESQPEKQRLIHVWKFTDAKEDDPNDPSFLKNRHSEGARINNLSELDASAYCKEEELARESEPQWWYELNERNWQRILEGRPNSELELWLDPDEKTALDKRLPVLLSGTAGSGKTTVSIYLLLRKYLESWQSGIPVRLLYVTYNEGLKRYARNLFKGLLLKDELEGQEGVLDNLFRTYRELCLELLKNHPEIDKFRKESQEMTFPGCYKQLQGKARQMDPTLIWEEIRSIIKGSRPSIHSPNGLLPLELPVESKIKGYKQLGSREAPLFSNQREEIYEIAQWYQTQLLRTNGFWDEIDLAKEAYHILESDQEVEKYDLILCDEAQDLTEVQLALLFLLCKNIDNMFFTGDVNQIINPSGFQWGDVKTAFWSERPRPPEPSLTWNHRSAGKIVELSNALLKLKKSCIPDIRHERVREQKTRWAGEAPYLVQGIRDGDLLNELLPGSDRCVLVRTKKQQDVLRDELRTEQVYTINEAKGLEWETVLLWKFFDGADAISTWREILQCGPRRSLSEAAIDHEISLLHVCLTRARSKLFIYDGENPSEVWNHDRFASYVQKTNIDYVREVWQKKSEPKEWWDQGDNLLYRRLYKKASECFEKAGDEALRCLSLALHHEELKEWPDAAKNREEAGQSLLKMLAEAAGKGSDIPFVFSSRFLDAGLPILNRIMSGFADQYRRAAQCWEAAERHHDAHRCWLWAGEDGEALRCEVELLKQEAELLEQQGEHEEAEKKYGEAARKMQVYADTFLANLGE